MEEPENNMSVEDARKIDNLSAVKKPKKRSLVERELETSLTAHVTSPATIADALSTSRYGRARRLKTETELIESQKIMLAAIKSPGNENTPVKVQSPVYRMHASNSPHKAETPKKALETYLDNQIDNIYQENMSLSRFSDETGSPSPAKKFPKVYIRKDLIQNREAEETIMLIKNLFSPKNTAMKSSNSPLSNNSLKYSSEKNNPKQNGHVDKTSVVKTLDFDSNKKKKKDNKDRKQNLSKNDLFELEAKCPYQVGDLAWARMGTFPFWPCIITRDPYSEMFVKKKLFGRVEHDVIHVTFFGDNGRRSWIVDNMLRNYLGQLEFEATREKFTPEDKKKDPKLYAAFFVSEKKQALWKASVEEAENLLREPKRLRIDLFNDMLLKFRASKKHQKSGKITRTNSDVSLSESLYDSLFSEQDVKTDDDERSKNRSRNKSFDVSEVVTACLDNMAAKTGITKIQKQSHMDRWLQKAKSKTPEKTLAKSAATPLKVELSEKPITKPPKPATTSLKVEKPEKSQKPPVVPVKLDRKISTKSKKPSTVPLQKPYRLRRSNESRSKLTQKAHDKNRNGSNEKIIIIDDISNNASKSCDSNSMNCSFDVITKVESLANKVEDMNQNSSTVISINNDTDDTVIQPINEPNIESATMTVQVKSKLSNTVDNVKQNTATMKTASSKNSDVIIHPTDEPTKKISGISISVNSEISDPPKATQHSVMKVDESTENVDKSIQDKREKSDTCVNRIISAMEVDDDTNSASLFNEEKSSLKSKTVSNESVEVQLNDNNCNIKSDTDMKEAQNVTIEASVTETKNDDNLNNQEAGELQEITDDSSKNTANGNHIDFLDVSNSHSVNIIETKPETPSTKNSSTPEKCDKIGTTVEKLIDISSENPDLENQVLYSNEATFFHKPETTDEKSNDILSDNLDIKSPVINSNETDFFYNPEKIIEEKDNIKRYVEDSHKRIDISTNIHIMDNEDVSMNSANDELNESGNSESILHQSFEIENPVAEGCTTNLESIHILCNESNKTGSFLEINKINFSVKEKDADVDDKTKDADSSIGKLENGTKSNFMPEENRDCSTRQYVESPTFTQLLESEEFFRDVNETCDNLKSNGSKSNDKLTKNHETINEVKNEMHRSQPNKTPVQHFDEDYIDDETSEDEPSPEYESLDEDITEDFRKHMMSIENNITDKKDEEQIVKICNEIAEKAKLSPTKYIKDVLVKPNDKSETISKDNLHTNLKDKLDISVEKQNKSELSDRICVDEEQNTQYIDEHKPQKIPVKNKVAKIHSNESDIRLNGNATMDEISVNSKIIYRTRLSVNSITKDRYSPDIKNESSEIKSRKSCEYDPKVVIMRLERDNVGFLKDSNNKTKSPEEEKSKTKISKSRLSLKRDRTIHNESKSIENSKDNLYTNPKDKLDTSVEKQNKSEILDRISLDEEQNTQVIDKLEPQKIPVKNKLAEIHSLDVKLGQSESLKPALLASKDEIEVTLKKVPKKINIENGAIETNIPEPIKVNGYNHNVNRKFTDTSDLIDDTDFDIDTISLNSEDSEVSLSNSVKSVSRRNLRSRPETTLENALKNPEFLKYLELRQDYLMDEHSELNEEEIVSYVYKTWQYEKDLKSDYKKIDDSHDSNLIKGLKQETPTRKKSKKSQPKNDLEKHFREKYEKCKKTFDFNSENGSATCDSCETVNKRNVPSRSSVDCSVERREENKEVAVKRKTRSKSPDSVDLTSESSNDVFLVKDKCKDLETISVKSEECLTPKRTLRSKAITPKSLENQINDVEAKPTPEAKVKEEREYDTESVDSEDSEVPLRQLRSKFLKENKINGDEKETIYSKTDLTSECKKPILETEVNEEVDETASTISDNEPLLKQKKRKGDKKSLEDPEFLKYLEMRKDALMDENPQLTQDDILSYLYKTWLYEENSKSDLKKNDELEQANLVKGLNNEVSPPKKVRRKPKVEKPTEDLEVAPKEKPRRKIVQPYYNENYSDIEDELEVFEIFKTEKAPITVVSKAETEKDKTKSDTKSAKDVEYPNVTAKVEEIDNIGEVTHEPVKEAGEIDDEVEYVDEIELYFTQLTKPKPNVFKGLIREKVCDICELTGNLVKCKGCNGMFHADCVKRETKAIEIESSLPSRGKKKKRKLVRKTKSLEDSESQSDEKSHDVSAEMSVEDIVPLETCTFDADTFETQLAIKMKELLDAAETNYDCYSSDDGIDWKDTVAGKCEIVDVKLKHRNAPIDYSNFKCNNCQKHDVPICFVCKSAVSKTNVKMRQKCHVVHCHKYYHLECLDHWPQTQFNSGEPSRNNKKINEFFEALTCPRHVCHTCVSDDPRGCKTRFSGDKLAKCVRCPATYHSFNKCLPAGSQILTASHIICPRHSDQRPGKVPCHVNTGWCFICALGGSLICCEYCPTSFHAECLNIKPPEGNYMCEDCETGRLPLYGEMVWVKLGHYRWWPGIILHPSEIPENIMAVKHGLGDFVVRFFGQYDHYWVNRGRVFPYQEGDSGRISSQKSRIDADFTTAIEHAQRAYVILKNAEPNEEESLDIASSLLPPHYVKLKCNKPCGSLCGRKVEDPSLSLTQCECNPDEPEPCGPYSQCLNRMLLTECGPTCRAGDRCNNRAFEKRLYPKLVPYRTPHRGWGLKTLEDIKMGQFVIEYVGELIDEEEFRRRMRRKHEIRDENFYFLTLDKERMIDAGPKGNAARFMNHCCEPNCETQKWTVLGDVRVGLFAIDDIPVNSEVTFNYNLECAGIEKKRCLCGAKRCSGYIGAKPKQNESQPKRGKDGKVAAKRAYKKRKVESPSTTKIKPKKPIGRPPKPKELTEIEKDLLIIKNATSISSDESSRSQSTEDKNPRTLKRKRVSITTDEVTRQEPSVKIQKCEEKPSEVGD